MNQILSQNEVEALLKAVGDDSLDQSVLPRGGEDIGATAIAAAGGARAAITTDRRFEEVRPLLEDLYEQTVRGFRSFLLGVLAKDLGVERFSLELVGYHDFTRRYDIYGRPYTFMPFELQPPDRMGVVIFEPGLAIGLMEGFMGGSLDQDPVPVWRQLTTLELKVAERMNRELLESMGKAFQSRLNIVLHPQKIMTNAHLVRGMKEMSSVVVAGMRTLIRGKALGEFYVLLPQDVVDGFLKNEGPVSVPSEDEVNRWDQALVDGIFGVDVVVTAELGSSQMTVRKLLQLKVGDSFNLETGRVGEATVKVEGVPKVRAMPGVFRGRKALRLL